MKSLLENRTRNDQKKTLIGGHRGCICQYEENTLSAMKEAMPWLNTFQEILQWAYAEDVYLMLELKSVPFDMQQVNILLVDQLIKDVLTYHMEQHVLAFGADYMVLRHLKSKYPTFQIGLIVPFVPANPVQLMQDMDALVYVSYIYNMTQEIIDALHKAGYFVDGAILREERWITLARSSGVDMYESDYLSCSYI